MGLSVLDPLFSRRPPRFPPQTSLPSLSATSSAPNSKSPFLKELAMPSHRIIIVEYFLKVCSFSIIYLPGFRDCLNENEKDQAAGTND
jgi:hypothetical protein